MNEFKITMEPGSGRILIGDIDISDSVKAVNVSHSVGTIPEVALIFNASHVNIDGTGILRTYDDPEAIAQAIRTLDPQTVEQAALERSPGMGHSLTPALLEVVAEMVSGSTA